MSNNKTTSNSGKRKHEKASVSNKDPQRPAGGELHQIAGGEHSALTTNQGVALSDNQNSLRANPRGPTLLEDFILRAKNHAFRSRAYSRAYRSRAGDGRPWILRADRLIEEIHYRQDTHRGRREDKIGRAH